MKRYCECIQDIMKLYMKCCSNSHPPIELSHGIGAVFGRSPETKITDKRCSRQQVELTADFANMTVTLKQLGLHPSIVGDVEVGKGESALVQVGEIFYFVSKEFPHQIIAEHNKGNKRKFEDYFTKKANKNNSENSKRPKLEDECNNHTSKENSVADKLKLLQQTNLSRKAKYVNQEGDASERTPSRDENSSPEVSFKKSKLSPGWSENGSLLLYTSPSLNDSAKIAAFDMDGTLITTASGRTFAKDKNDWKILYSEVPGKLKKIHKEGYKIVIVTNQLGIGRGKISVADFEHKVENILKILGVPVQVLAITKRGPFRKPNIGCWTYLEEHGSVPVDKKQSYYVGDAAGRPKDWAPKKKKDFSCSDRLFAINLGIEFKTPEEFFLLNKPVKYDLPAFNPMDLSFDIPLTSEGKNVVSAKQEVIVMVGYPASGKSTFARNHLVSEGYFYVNRDNMKTWQKCVASCLKALSEGKSVVIDNTNPDAASRQRFIECAKKHGCSCRCFKMEVSFEHAKHNNRFRELSGSEHDKVPDMVLFQYRKTFKEPTLEEGFSDVVKINFVPEFESDEIMEKYRMYTD